MSDEKPQLIREAEQKRATYKIPRLHQHPKQALDEEREKGRQTLEKLRWKRLYRDHPQRAWRIMQRLGDKGREWMPFAAGTRSITARYMPAQELPSQASNASFVWFVVVGVFWTWFGFARAFGSWLPWEW